MNSRKMLFTMICFAGLWSCNENLQFRAKIESTEITKAVETPLTQDPDIPIPVIPPSPQLTKSSGACASDSSTNLTSCLKCQVPDVPPQEPPMSEKAKSLYGIMTKACHYLAQKSPKTYSYLDDKKFLIYLNRCSATSYPDTKLSALQQSVITDLNNENTDTLRKKMFGGLWYQPPYSTAFETYFGLEVGEAVALLCQEQLPLQGRLLDAGYWQSEDRWNYQLPPEYVTANQYRSELIRCMSQSVHFPWTPGPEASPKKCKFEVIEGVVNEDYKSELKKWLQNEWKIGIENTKHGLCQEMKDISDVANLQGDLKSVAYYCE